MPMKPDPAEVSRLTQKALKHVFEVLERDSKAVADTLTAEDDPSLGPLLRLHLLAEQVFDRVFAFSFRNAEHVEIGPEYDALKRAHGANLKLLAIFTLSKAYEPFLGAALTGEAVAKVKAEEAVE